MGRGYWCKDSRRRKLPEQFRVLFLFDTYLGNRDIEEIKVVFYIVWYMF